MRRLKDEPAQRNGVNKLAAEVTANPDLAGLQAWGERVLWEYEAGGFQNNFERNSTQLASQAVPAWLRSAWVWPPTEIYLSEAPSNGVRYLFVEWPDGCGLAVGRTNSAPSAAWNLKYLTNIVPGVYAYHD